MQKCVHFSIYVHTDSAVWYYFPIKFPKLNLVAGKLLTKGIKYRSFGRWSALIDNCRNFPDGNYRRYFKQFLSISLFILSTGYPWMESNKFTSPRPVLKDDQIDRRELCEISYLEFPKNPIINGRKTWHTVFPLIFAPGTYTYFWGGW